MVRHFLAFAMTAGLIWGQAPLSPALAPVAPPSPVQSPSPKKGSGLERQRASVKRQLGDIVEAGWLFRPWPKAETRGGVTTGTAAPVVAADTTATPPAPVSQ